MDEGPILGQAIVPVFSDDTEESLNARVLIQEHMLYPKILQDFIKKSKNTKYTDI
jgi:phosphoribosylglycinamide formyltransferase-1